MKQERLSKQSKLNRLDLGLNSILSSFGDDDRSCATTNSPSNSPEITSTSEPNFILVSPVGAPEVPAQKAPPTLEKTEYEILAEQERWPELAQLCESRLSKKEGASSAESRDVVEARLWWIKSQLVNGGVPMSILAAPLESASSSVIELQKQPGMLGLREKSLIDFCAQMLKKVSSELAANSEHVLALSFLERAYTLDQGCGAQLRSAVERELERLAKNPRAQLDPKIKVRIARLETLRRELKTVKVAAEPVAEIDAQEAGDPKSAQVPAEPARRRPLRVYASATLLLLLCAGGIVWFVQRGALSGARADLALDTVISARLPNSQLPELQRVSGVSNLDALYYDIDSATNKRRPEVVQAAVSSTTNSATDGQNVSEVKQAKAVVNTSTPVEGPEFQNLKDDASENDGSRRDDLFADVAARTQSAMQGMPVEKFDSDRLFLVLTKTNVMARPSFHTAALAELESGDKVLVESKVGQWLKLRSKHGQAGYILAQDAELTTKRSAD